MKSKFFKAIPGWGDSTIDTIINDWLEGKGIKVNELKYGTHEKIQKDGRTAIVYTAIILYEDIA